MKALFLVVILLEMKERLYIKLIIQRAQKIRSSRLQVRNAASDACINIDSLPDELLLKIFFCLYCMVVSSQSVRSNSECPETTPSILNSSNKLYPLVSITHICRRWRTLSIEYPILWTCINSYVLLRPHWTREYLRRSRDLKLFVKVSDTISMLFLQTVTSLSKRALNANLNKSFLLVLDHRERIKYLILENNLISPFNLSLSTWAVIQCLLAGILDTFPSLCEFSIGDWPDPNGIMNRQGQFETVSIPYAFTSSLPNLKSLSINHPIADWPRYDFRNLRELRIYSDLADPDDDELFLPQLLMILNGTPILETLTLCSIALTAPAGEDCMPTKLPKLKELRIETISYAVCQQLLSYLTLGQEVALTITCTECLPIPPSPSAEKADALCAKLLSLIPQSEEIWISIDSDIIITWEGKNLSEETEGFIRFQDFKEQLSTVTRLNWLNNIVRARPWLHVRLISITLSIDGAGFPFSIFGAHSWTLVLENIPNAEVLILTDLDSLSSWLPGIFSFLRRPSGSLPFFLPRLKSLSLQRFDFRHTSRSPMLDSLLYFLRVRDQYGFRLQQLDLFHSFGIQSSDISEIVETQCVDRVCWNPEANISFAMPPFFSNPAYEGVSLA